MKSKIWYNGGFIDDNRAIRHVEEGEGELLAEAPVEASSALNVNAPSFGEAGVTVKRRLGRS